MDYTELSEQFIETYPEFYSDSSPYPIENALKRALVFISVLTYGDFFYEALFAQTASFLYSSDLIKRNQNGILTSRSVAGEYSVSYAASTTSDGKFINPYQQHLESINVSIGLGLGMIL